MSSREYGQDVEIDLGRKNNSRKKEVITSKRPSRARGTEAITGKCKICGSNSWDTDTVRGETICSECGFVAAENMIDPGAEWTNHSGGEDRSRVGAPTSLTISDKGLSTEIRLLMHLSCLYFFLFWFLVACLISDGIGKGY